MPVHTSLLLVLDTPNITTSPESKRDASILSQITGVVGIEGIYDVDLLKSFPSDFYRGFVEQAYGTRSRADSGPERPAERLPYNDVNAAKYILPPSGTAGSLDWAIIHSRGDDLVDLVQAESCILIFVAYMERKNIQRERALEQELF